MEDFNVCVVSCVFVWTRSYLCSRSGWCCWLVKNWQAKQRTYKIIAENSVQEIKDHLINKHESSEVFENEFTDNYCLHNKESIGNYRNNILPYIRSMIQTDDLLEEAYVMRDGSQRCVWRLKSTQMWKFIL
jgi:hypothetical protein